jgi:predicted protein tyrosine phosphatase
LIRFLRRRKKQPTELIVLSRDDAERYEPRGKEICISIGDPLAAPAQLSDRFAAVLRLSFHDITAHPSPDDILFAEEHAERILRFVQQWSGVDRIVVHCLAGVSRSPGTALGLCDVLGWPAAELERRHPAFNRRVRTVIAKCGATSARPNG